MSDRKRLGKWGEQAAASFLEAKGYTILERNARTPYGEIDLVALQKSAEDEITLSGETLVFVEVKTRSTSTFGFPEQAVNAHKQEHMLAAAQAYAQSYPGLPEHWRFDVIAVERRSKNALPEIHHFENILHY